MNNLRWYRHPAHYEKLFKNMEEHGCDCAPSTNVQENNDAYKIELAVPGYSKKDFKIDLEKDRLSISSEKENATESSNENYTRKEFSYGSFQRSFTLPDTIEAEKINDEYNNGILVVTLPKKEEVKIKKEIKVA